MPIDIQQRGGEFSNIIIQRIKNPFWRDVSSITTTTTATTKKQSQRNAHK